ncbi:MAG: hypothetical protein A2386_00470 [Elusimicrobia bacterium RIFOXYB1_FULL_48_9]|nr:MAG: hypothetical protein A2386_00470 [Elusimicrobia bacterium RIFOXYB1_FULL_48_9]
MLRQHNLKDYIKVLRDNNAELNNLYDDLLINVTKFFRDAAVFGALKKKVLAAVIKENKKNQLIKIWVPGCAGGEEVYSIAICVAEALGNKIASIPVQIFGSDISEKSIDKARRGLYPKSIEADITPERLKRFFTKDGDSYRVSKQLRSMCIFSRQNVFNDPPFSNLDLISCRNLLIYLQPALQRSVFNKFHYALRPGGFLLLGNSESAAGYAGLFKVMDRKHKIFIKKYTPMSPKLEIGRQYYLPEKLEIKEKTGLMKSRETDIGSLVEQAVLEQYAASGVLLNSDMDVIQFRGHTGRYLESSAGKPSHNIFKLTREGLALPLRAAINKARDTKRAVSKEAGDVWYGGRRLSLNVTVIPVKSGALKEEFYLVLFDENSGGNSGKKTSPLGKNAPKIKHIKNDELLNLRNELMETKEYLQTVIEEHESANEEVKTANEEILSSNEELQSTNEELETAKEELQSSNEELITTNEELQNRNREANLLNNDLVNLLSSINMPVIMMDTGLVIRRITPQAERALNVVSADVGREITKIKLSVEIPDLEKILMEVIESLHPKTFEVRSGEGNWYSANIRPYRTLDNRIDGVVAVFVDITGIKKAQEITEEARDYSENIVETVREPLIVMDSDLNIISANKSYYMAFKTTAAETQGRLVYDLPGKQWDIPALRKLLEGVSAKNEPFDGYRVEQDFGTAGKKILLLSARQITRRTTGRHLILMAVEDVTVTSHMEKELMKVQKLDSLGILAGGIAHDFNNILTGIIGNLSMIRGSKDNEVLSDVMKAAVRAKNLTLQLLTFAKGGAPVKKLTVIKDIIRDSSVFATHGSRTICKFHIAANLHPLIVDPGQIAQVISNMVINAVQAMSEGGIINISAENINLTDKTQLPIKSGDYVRISIKDTGAGIAAGDLGKIFDPYFSTKEGGSGLGLATSYSIIKNHDGYTTVKSDEGIGTLFEIYLPAVIQQAGIETPVVSREIIEGRGRILILDDEEIIRVLGLRMLTKLGYVAECFDDSEKAIERYKQAWGTAEAFEAVILDLTLPGRMGGKEVLGRLKSINPEIKAIVSSGYSEDKVMANHKEYGFSAVLQKPYDIEEVSAILHKLLMKNQ